MDLLEILRTRKSIRSFRPDPVTKEQIEEMLQLVIHAPSAINLQPWDFYVVMGEEKARLSRRLVKLYREKQISCSPGNVKPLSAEFHKRGAESFILMNPYLEKMGMDFNRFVNEGSCNFYGAPTAVIMCLDNAFSEARLVDIGIALGYFVLIAHNFGFSTCPIGLINAYEDDIKEILNIPENKDVVIGLALGYSDDSAPINEFTSPRDDVSNFVHWID